MNETQARKDFLNAIDGVIKVSRARSTGVIVFAVDGERFGVDTNYGAEPFSTICDEHGGVCSHTTKTVALSWLSAPEQWCPFCME